MLHEGGGILNESGNKPHEHSSISRVVDTSEYYIDIQH